MDRKKGGEHLEITITRNSPNLVEYVVSETVSPILSRPGVFCSQVPSY